MRLTKLFVVLFIVGLSGCAATPDFNPAPPPPESETGPFSRTDLDTSWSVYDRDSGRVFYHDDLTSEGKTLDDLERYYRVLGYEIIDRDNNERVTTVASGFNTLWTVCFTGFTKPQECHQINLMDVTPYDPSRARTNFAKTLAGRGTEEARKIDNHWLFVALRALERKISRETPDFVVIKVDADRTWHVIPN